MNAEQQQAYEQFVNINKLIYVMYSDGKDVKNIISQAAKHNINISEREYDDFIKLIVKGKSQSYLKRNHDILINCCIIKHPTNAQIKKNIISISF